MGAVLTVTYCNTQQQSATLCKTLQHTATHCNTLQHTATHCNTLQHTATHCNTLQHIADAIDVCECLAAHWCGQALTATFCTHTATHYTRYTTFTTPQILQMQQRPNAAFCCRHALQHTATHCTTLQYIATHCTTHCRLFAAILAPRCPSEMPSLQVNDTYCNILLHADLQHTATYCNILLHHTANVSQTNECR